MLEKTLGIVLSIIPHDDQKQFVHIYTERFGKETFSVSAKRSRRSPTSRSMFAPLTLLDLDVEHRAHSEIHRIKDAHILSSPYLPVSCSPYTTTQCIFMAELLDKCIREIEPNPTLWQYIQQSVKLLESGAKDPNFHLIFTVNLCSLIGFHIDTTNYSPGMQFDVSEGIFTHAPIFHPYYLLPESAEWLHRLLCLESKHSANLQLNHIQRNTLLDMLLTFLKLHIPEMGEVRSITVLKEIFS